MTRGKPTQQENASWELRKKKWEVNNEPKGGKKGDCYVLEILGGSFWTRARRKKCLTREKDDGRGKKRNNKNEKAANV